MNFFTIHLDRQTSEHAGAGGMFQVASIEDADGNDVTDVLVDVGKHYSDQERLKLDIAAKLGASVDLIELQEV